MKCELIVNETPVSIPASWAGCRDCMFRNESNEVFHLSFLVPQMHAIHQAVELRCLSSTHFVKWPVSFVNLFAAYLWCCENGDLNLFPRYHDRLPWPLMQNWLLETQNVLVCVDMRACSAFWKQKVNAMTRVTFMVSMRRKWALMRNDVALEVWCFRINTVAFCINVCSQVTQQHLWWIILFYSTSTNIKVLLC